MKLTIIQSVAANIIDQLLHQDVTRKEGLGDDEGKYWADRLLQRHVTEHAEYIDTGDREKLVLVKEYTYQLYDIFKRAKEDWDLKDGRWSEEFLENCKYE